MKNNTSTWPKMGYQLGAQTYCQQHKKQERTDEASKYCK